MASKTQIRATQITGSFPTDGESITTEATAVVTDLGGILDHMASSIRRIHGNADWSNSAAGVFTAATFDVDTAGAFDVVAGGIASIDAVGTSNLTTHGALTLSGSDSLSLASDGGEIDITARQGAIDINATAGAITLDAGGAVSLEGAAASDFTTSAGALTLDGAGGVSIAGNAAEIDITTSAALDLNSGAFTLDATTVSIDGVGAANLTTRGALTVSGSSGLNLASDSGEIDITARQGAIDVNALVGDITVDATAGDITVAAAGGDITIGATLASSKALNLGRPGSAEITLVVSDVAANEKIAIVNTAGTADDAIKLLADAGGITLQADDDSLILDANGTDADALKVDSAGGVDITSTGAHPIDIESTNAAGHIVLKTAHTAGQAVHIDADADAGSIVDIDAGILQIDATGVAGINSGGTLSLGTANSGVAVNIGHGTSETTVGDNLTVTGNATVTGDLTVNGDTVTLNTSNQVLEDRIIALASGSSTADVDSGIIFTRSTADLGGGTDKKHGALQFDGATGNVFKLGVTNDDASGTTIGVADADLADLYIGKLFIDGGSNTIDVSTDLILGAAADVTFTAAGGNVTPSANDGAALGSAAKNWSDLFIADAGVINLGDDQDVKLTHVANTGVLLSGSDSGGPGAAAQLQFGDSGTYLHQVANGVLKVVSDNILDLSVGAGGVTITGTTPKLTLGDAGAEDTTILFDGNAQDFYIALDDSADDLLIGLGATVGTTPALGIDEDLQVSVKVNTAASSTTTGALTVAGGMGIAADLYVGDDLRLRSDDSVFAMGLDGDDFSIIHDGTTGATIAGNPLTLDSAAGLVLDADSGTISLKDGGALYGELTKNDVGFVMSASAELHLGDSRSGVEGMAGGTIGLGVTGQYTSFISNFSNSTTIVGALNTLAEGGTRSKFQLAITGSNGHTANMALLVNGDLAHDEGFNPGTTDVFVNGQMMMSGASANDGDYKLHGQTAIGGEAVVDMVTFFFALERDDVVTVIKM
tara:strand:- start:10948 stop:13947 length:3000 start_codon:yes stop_codon:yes gene_type:complete